MVKITIEINDLFADAVSGEISDWICWASGVRFAAKTMDEWERPFIPDHNNLSELNGKIKEAMTAAKNEKETQ